MDGRGCDSVDHRGRSKRDTEHLSLSPSIILSRSHCQLLSFFHPRPELGTTRQSTVCKKSINQSHQPRKVKALHKTQFNNPKPRIHNHDSSTRLTQEVRRSTQIGGRQNGGEGWDGIFHGSADDRDPPRKLVSWPTCFFTGGTWNPLCPPAWARPGQPYVCDRPRRRTWERRRK